MAQRNISNIKTEISLSKKLYPRLTGLRKVQQKGGKKWNAKRNHLVEHLSVNEVTWQQVSNMIGCKKSLSEVKMKRSSSLSEKLCWQIVKQFKNNVFQRKLWISLSSVCNEESEESLEGCDVQVPLTSQPWPPVNTSGKIEWAFSERDWNKIHGWRLNWSQRSTRGSDSCKISGWDFCFHKQTNKQNTFTRWNLMMVIVAPKRCIAAMKTCRGF